MADVSVTGLMAKATAYTGANALGGRRDGNCFGHQVRAQCKDYINIKNLLGNYLSSDFSFSNQSRNTAISVIDVEKGFQRMCLEKLSAETAQVSQTELDTISGLVSNYVNIEKLKLDIINTLRSWSERYGVRGLAEEFSKRTESIPPYSQNSCSQNPDYVKESETHLAEWITNIFKETGHKSIEVTFGWCHRCGTVGFAEELSRRTDCIPPYSQNGGSQNPDYVKNNATHIAKRIKGIFEDKGHKSIEVTHGSTQENTFEITVSARDPGKEGITKKHEYVYSSRSIERGRNNEECRHIFDKEVATDLTVRQFYIKYPDAFDDSTSLYIKTYNSFEYTLSLCHKGQIHIIPLDRFCNIYHLEFSEDDFQEVLKESGLSYQDLLGGPDYHNLPVDE